MASCLGEVVLDGSIGGAAGALNGPDFVIPHTRGDLSGGNLFHSFARFSLGSGESASFTGPGGVSNILARVTGGELSTINGIIQSDIAGADFYLINPAGIVFWDGAAVDIKGAFTATTADYIEFSDGGRFAASPTGEVSLLTASPELFGFLETGDGAAGIIRVESGSTASLLQEGLNGAGEDLRFVGRAVIVDNAYLKSAGGEIGIVAMGSGAGSAALDLATGRLAETNSAMGEVRLTSAPVSVSGQDGGRVLIRAGRITIEGERRAFVRNPTEVIQGIEADGDGSARAGLIDIGAGESLTIRDRTRLTSVSNNSEAGGLISLRSAGDFSLLNGGQVVVSATSSGDGGSVELEARNALIDGQGNSRPTRLSAQSNSTASGSGGDIRVVTTESLTIVEGGSIVANTFGAGDAGSINVKAGALEMRSGASTAFTGIASVSAQSSGFGNVPGYGEGGDVTVEVSGTARIADRAVIQTGTFTDAEGGLLLVKARDLIISGSERLGVPNAFLTGILGITTWIGQDDAGEPIPGGRGGDIVVEVINELRLVAGGLIDASSFGGGDGGDVTVTADSIFADRDGSDFFTGVGSDTEAYDDRGQPNPIWGGPGGNAGTISVSVKGDINLLNGATISSSTAGSGNAGSISVSARDVFVSGSGSNSINVPGPDAGIVALAEAGLPTEEVPPSSGNAGLVTVTATGTVEIQEGGRIAGEALGSGTAGGVEVVAGDAEISGGTISVLSRESQAGLLELMIGGDLLIQDGFLTASAGTDGGSISISGGELIFIDRSRVDAEALNDGGDLGVAEARFLIVDGSVFSARAINGDGGNIAFDTTVFFANLSVFDVSSQFGAAGLVRIDPEVALSGNEGEVDLSPLDETDSLQPECTSRIPTKAGSLIRAGRGGTERRPGGYLPSLRLIR